MLIVEDSNMRRFLAYVIMLVTMLFAIVFNTQAVLENKIDAMEYGTGTQLVYSLTGRDATDYSTDKYPDYSTSIKELSEIDIEKAVMDRLDAAGVRNADVSIVEGKKNDSGKEVGYELRISLSPLSDTELSNVKEILAFSGELSIGTENDTAVYYASNDEFFDYDSDVADLIYSGTTPYPVIKVKDSTVFDELKKAAEEANSNNASEAKRFYADGDDDSEEESATIVYLWMNKTLDDTYDKAYGTHDTVVMQETKAKVLAEIDLANWNSDDLELSLTTDSEGNAFTISTARAFVNMLNCDDYGFDISLLYENSVSATFGSSAINLTYIIFGVTLLVICALLIAFYGLSGLTASLTLLGSVVLSFFLFSILGFEFSIAALSGLAVIVVLSIVLSINYFERVKNELKNGRDIIKANQEGYHKAFLSNLDIFAITLISSIFCFLIGTGSFKTFFGVIMIGSIFTYLITNFLNKWMIYWLIKDNAEAKLPFFSFKKTSSEAKHNFTVKSASMDKKHITNKTLIFIPIVSALLMAICLPTAYALNKSNKSYFNNSGDFANSYVLNITFQDNSQAYERLSTSEVYTQYLVDMGSQTSFGKYTAYSSENSNGYSNKFNEFVYYPDTATVNIVEKTDEENNKYYMMYYSIKVNKDLTFSDSTEGYSIQYSIEQSMLSDSIESSNYIISPIVGDSHYEVGSLVVNSYEVKATNVLHTSNYLILVSFLITCFVFCYLLLRFGLNVSLASLATGTVANMLYLGLLALIRIPFSSYTSFGLLIAIMVLNIFFIPVFAKNKEILREKGVKNAISNEERVEIANSSLAKSFTMIAITLGVLLVFAIGCLFINSSLIGLSISLVLFLLLDVLMLYFFGVPFYLFITTHLSFKKMWDYIKNKQEERNKKKGIKNVSFKHLYTDGNYYVDDGPHETIIPGLNDFPKSNN